MSKQLYPKEQVVAAALAHINRADEITAIRTASIAALSKFDGKKVTKAFATAIEKMLPGYTTSYAVDGYGSFQTYRITVWGQGLGFGDRESFYLTTENGVFDFASFRKDLTACMFHAAEYVKGIREKLPAYDELAARLVRARDEYEAAQAAFGSLSHFAVK